MGNNKLIIGVNDLATTNPELIAEWHPTKNNINPCDISKGSTRKVWWLGKCGHEWQASPNDRTHRPRGCPYCSGNRILKGFNDLLTTNPVLASEWHPQKNGILTPSDVSAGSEKKVWWLGKCGHEWQASIKSRNMGRGCPYCSNTLLLVGYNDLATTNPKLALEWDLDKNGNLTPQDIIGGSHKKIWWKCKNGHEWQATCNSRNDSGKGCPICSAQTGAIKKRRGLIEHNGSLQDNNPVLASEWHPQKNGIITPADVSVGSGKKVWWQGKCGHEWQAVIKDRNNGIGCPICSNLQLLQGYNDLETVRPDLAKEWHPSKNGNLQPNSIVSGSSAKIWWKCQKCGFEWIAPVINRKNGNGCPKCSAELNTSYPEQALFYYIKQLFPEAINRYSELGKELDVFIPSINVGIEYDGLRYHTEKTTQKEKNKDTFFAELGIKVYRIKESKSVSKIQGNTITYRITSSYSTLDAAIRKLLQLLKTEHEIDENLLINNRDDMSKILASYLTYQKDNSIARLKPELLKEWNSNKNGGLNPDLLSACSNKKVWWKCSIGHEWQAVVYSRYKGSGCPYCQNKKVLPGYNDLETIKPNLVKEWDFVKNGELLPSSVQPGSNKKVWWKCQKCGHEWQALISNRSNGSGCPLCARKSAKRKKK